MAAMYQLYQYLEMDNLEITLEHGANKFFKKPIDLPIFIENVQEMLPQIEEKVENCTNTVSNHL